jgi:hypothetical protein
MHCKPLYFRNYDYHIGDGPLVGPYFPALCERLLRLLAETTRLNSAIGEH